MSTKKIQRIYRLSFLVIFLIVGSIGVVWWNWYNQPHTLQDWQISKVCVRELCANVLLAISPEAQEKWLMYVTGMDQNKWMLFVFPITGIYKFWMKNTLISLDMIWIDDDKRIVDIVTAPICEKDPCSTYGPDQNARYVLELNAWIASQWWWKIWDVVEFK